MQNNNSKNYLINFIPYALAAFLIGIVGGFTSVLAPAFVQDLNLDYNNTTWTALAMAISSAAFAPILGKLSDSIGRRITLFIGIGIFTLGNIVSAIANSLFIMILARFIVGIGIAAIAPVVMSYIVTEFPPEKVAKGFSIYMLISSVAVVFGPTIGGLLITYYGWRIMMWVCVTICIIIFLLGILIPSKEKIQRKPLTNFNTLGSIFVLIFFGLLLCVPSFGQNIGWNSSVLIGSVLATLIAGVGLYLAEKKAPHPILQWNFMKRKNFILSVLALFLTQGLMQANMTNIIVFINYTQPANTILSGYAISIMYIGMSLGSILIGPLADRYEPKYVLIGSLLLTTLGCAILLLFSTTTSLFLLASSLGILGFGLGGNGTIFMKLVLSDLPSETASSGTGTYGLFRDLAAPFGVAVLVPLFTNRITNRISLGESSILAAVNSIQFIGFIEVICVVLGIGIVLFLPTINKSKMEQNYETKK